MPTIKKRASLSKEPTRFGKWVEKHRVENGISIEGLCDRLGILYDNYKRMTNGPYTSIYLPTVIEMARIFDTSPLVPLFILYDQQAVTADLTETEKKMDCLLLTVFDRFYRLDERSVEMVISIMDGIIEKDPEKRLTDLQEKFINRLRISPAGGAGNSKIEDRLLARQNGSSESVVPSDEPTLSGTEEI